jgi:hypothetical protein
MSDGYEVACYHGQGEDSDDLASGVVNDYTSDDQVAVR